MMHCRGKVKIDITPVDIITNNILITTCHGALANQQIHIYNCATSVSNPVSISEYKTCLISAYNQIQLNQRARDKIQVTFEESELNYNIKKSLYQEAPIKVIDFVSKMPLVGSRSLKKQAQTLEKSRIKLNNIADMFKSFFNTEWYYENKKIYKITSMMTPQERIEFNYDCKSINWMDYTTLYC